MVRLSIELPEDLRARVAARATESGHATIEEYVASLIRADADGAAVDYVAPAGRTFRTQADLEGMLLDGLASPATEMAPKDWDELRRTVNERRGK